MFDYEILKLIWWLLIGVLLVGFAVTDGFDMGAVSLLKLVGKTDNERRIILNTLGPHWEGNQVWFVTAGGAIFAAWPVVYAVAFSGLYWALLLVLFALFFRPVGFEYRSKIETERWRDNWDWLMTAGSAIPALVFGVAFGNLFLGLPFELDNYMRSTYTGSFWQLLNPFALLCGVVSLSMLMMHGGAFLQMRTQADLRLRVRCATMVATAVTGLCFLVAGWWLSGMNGFSIIEMPEPGSAMTPLAKQVELVQGGWMSNYSLYAWSRVFPAAAFAGLILTVLMSAVNRSGFAFLFSSVSVAAIICTAGFSLFPFIFPSTINPVYSLTVWDSVSSEKTLMVMFVVAALFVPLILAYTLWSYYKMWGRLNTAFIEDNKFSVY